MKLTVDRASFAGVLDTVAKFVPKSHMKDSFTGVELNAHNGMLYIRAGDEVRGILTDMPATVEEEGLVVVEHSRLTGLIKNLQTPNMQLQADGKKLTLGTGKSKYSLGLFNPDEFMPMPEQPQKLPQTIYGLGEAIKHCAYTQNKHEFNIEVKPDQMVFTNIWVGSGRCVAVSQDRARLSSVQHDTKEMDTFLLPSVVLPFIRDYNSLDVAQTDIWLFMHTPKGLIYVRKGEGEFPVAAVDKLLQRQIVSYAEVNRQDLLNALIRLSQVSNIGHFQISNEGIHIESAYQGHKGSEDIVCQYDGEVLQYNITSFLFIELLKSCVSDTIKLGFVGEGLASIFIYDGNDTHIVATRAA